MWNKLVFNQKVKFVGQSGQFGVVSVLYVSSSHYNFEKLPLKHYLLRTMQIFSFNTKLLNQVRIIRLLLNLIFICKVFLRIVVRHYFFEVILPACCSVKSVQKIELSNFFSSKQSKVILFTLIVYPIELNQGCVRAGYLTVT